MKKKGLFFIKCIVFLVVFCFLYTCVNEVLKDKRLEGEYNPSAKIRGFYQEPKNSLDFVFIGSSQLYADIVPAVLFEKYGMTSYDFCANEQPLSISYYYIKEALKRQNPKAIVLDVFTIYGADYEAEGINHFSLDDMPMSLNKLRAIHDSVPKELRYSYYFELAKYHDTWSSLDQKKVQSAFYQKRDIHKGYSPFVVAHAYADEALEEVKGQTEKEEIPERALYWLDQIVELCEKENVPLVFIKTPNGNAERQKLYNSFSDYATEKSLPFLNMNTVFDGEAHINILQAEKVTSYVGEYLNANFTIEDKRQNPAYDSWQESVSLFHQLKRNCEIISETDTNQYFTKSLDKGLLQMICIRDGEAMRRGYQNGELDDLGNLLKPLMDKAGFEMSNEKQLFTGDSQHRIYILLQNGLLKAYFDTNDTENVLGNLSISNEDEKTTVVIESIMEADNLQNSCVMQFSSDAEGSKMKLLIEDTNYCFDEEGINFVNYDMQNNSLLEYRVVYPDSVAEIKRVD